MFWLLQLPCVLLLATSIILCSSYYSYPVSRCGDDADRPGPPPAADSHPAAAAPACPAAAHGVQGGLRRLHGRDGAETVVASRRGIIWRAAAGGAGLLTFWNSSIVPVDFLVQFLTWRYLSIHMSNVWICVVCCVCPASWTAVLRGKNFSIGR